VEDEVKGRNRCVREQSLQANELVSVGLETVRERRACVSGNCENHASLYRGR
jgi:hypothetical protein